MTGKNLLFFLIVDIVIPAYFLCLQVDKCSDNCFRNMIAILDHNHNLTRADQLSSNGNPYINCQLSRRTKEWVAYKRMEAKP